MDCEATSPPSARKNLSQCGNYTPLTVTPGSSVQIPVQFTVPTTGHSVSGQLELDSMSLTFATTSNIGVGTGFIQNTGDCNCASRLQYRYAVS